jgi:ATP-dependent Clp protease adaptor protein ClpS
MKNEVQRGLDVRCQLIVPPLYRVILHNDDFTPMEFVVGMLEIFFYMSRGQAVEAMMAAHVKGQAECGLFSKDFAESKVEQAVAYARRHEHPLNYSMEAVW